MKAPFTKPTTCTEREDIREQLFNEGLTGPISHVQVSTERIAKLRGILFDIDPDILQSGLLLPQISLDPVELYEQTVKVWLDRHPTLRDCEVRMSGRGLHLILWFDEPVELATDRELDRWGAIVEVVQASLPIDPDQPGITACTRALGSINSKNGAEVVQLAAGRPVSQQRVLELLEQMSSAPFQTVMEIVTGSCELSPCPVCGKADQTLKALSHAGSCYGSCGRVQLEQLYDQMFKPRPEPQGEPALPREEVSHATR